MDYDNIDNIIEFVKNSDRATLTFTQKKWVSKIKKYAETHEDCEVVAENEDGSICAHVPVKWIKISPPKKVSDEQRAKASERFKEMHKNKNS